MDDKLLARLDFAVQRNRREQVDFLQRLIRAKSANPFTPEDSSPVVPIEREVAYLIYDKLRVIGLMPEFRGASSERPNVVGALRGFGSERTLILNGHMDTVMPSPHWQMDPFAGTIRDNCMYGLGALDMKASLSVFIFAAQAVIEAGVKLGGDVLLTFVVDEEPGAYSPFGLAYLLNQGLTGTAAIVAEPENDNVTIGHRGGYRFKLTVHGESVHTGMADWERGSRGRNAILDMARVVTALSDFEVPYSESAAFPGRKPVFTFPTLIRGGTSINMVPDECSAYGDVRLLPGVDDCTIEDMIRERLDSIDHLDYTLERLLFVPSCEISPSEEIVQILTHRAGEVLGKPPTTYGSGPWNDAWMLLTRGIPTVAGFGPNGGGAHGPDEFVDLDSVIDTTRIYARAIVDYVGMASF